MPLDFGKEEEKRGKLYTGKDVLDFRGVPFSSGKAGQRYHGRWLEEKRKEEGDPFYPYRMAVKAETVKDQRGGKEKSWENVENQGEGTQRSRDMGFVAKVGTVPDADTRRCEGGGSSLWVVFYFLPEKHG